jgi:DNA-binding NtrC family response regulator
LDLDTIFVVDDEEHVREGIAMTLEGRYALELFADAESAIPAIRDGYPDLVLLDIGLPGLSGLEALPLMKQRCPDLRVVIITAFEDVKSIVQAMKLGAHDYVVKPLRMETLEVSINNALETIRLKKEVRALQERHLRDKVPCFIGESDEIREVMAFVKLVAASPDTPVMILGETGTGKELIAGAIHYRSPNFRGPLVSVNCAAIPKDLIESELFGYEKGAFTGASPGGKKGMVELADGGTLFLDEVGDMPLEVQAKLLRFLEEGEFYRVGGTRQIRVRARVVSATNKDPAALIEKGQFREDLLYRLAVVKVRVPSLARRKEDIVPLAMYFLESFGRKFGRTYTGVSGPAREALRSYPWRGNIRELRNAIERAAIVSAGPELSLKDLGLEENSPGTGDGNARSWTYPAMGPSGIELQSEIEGLERHFLREALARTEGNENQAAQLLRMNYHTFRYRRKKLLP